MIKKVKVGLKMKQLAVKVYPMEDYESRGYQIDLKRDTKKTLSIIFGGALDLHFILRNFNEDKNFIIGKDNYQVYEIFDELYKEIVNTKVSDNLKDVYHQLVKSSIITWKHDDYPEDLAPSMQIIPLENAYVL